MACRSSVFDPWSEHFATPIDPSVAIPSPCTKGLSLKFARKDSNNHELFPINFKLFGRYLVFSEGPFYKRTCKSTSIPKLATNGDSSVLIAPPHVAATTTLAVVIFIAPVRKFTLLLAFSDV